MKTIIKIIFLSLTVTLLSCEDIIEEDITNDIVQILFPTNNLVIESNVVDFQWESLKGADKYHVQVFGENQKLVLDSLVTKTNLTHSFEQGDYLWRVRGENFAYQSVYTSLSKFTIVISNDLTYQKVILSSPQDNSYFNLTDITLTWQKLANATTYSVEVYNETSGILAYSFYDITATSVILNNLVDGNYEWRVKAYNSATETSLYSARKFSVDTVNPNQPQNVTPSNNSTYQSNQQVAFTWTIAPDSGTVKSPISYEIQFSNDQNFATIIQSSIVNSASFQQNFSTSETYYWRIYAIDDAGNLGLPSNTFKFTIN